MTNGSIRILRNGLGGVEVKDFVTVPVRKKN